MIHKQEKVVILLNNNEKVVIPSRLYPLESTPFRILNEENTEPVLEQTIIELFDRAASNIGQCFTNIEQLVKNLNEAGYDAKQYVGWAFIFGDSQPIHHSVAVLDNSILDLRVNTTQLLKDLPMGNYSLDERRQLLAQRYKLLEQLPNHQKCVIGKCCLGEMYVMAEATKEQGQIRNRTLRTEYIDHPAFRDVRANGQTMMQSMILDNK